MTVPELHIHVVERTAHREYGERDPGHGDETLPTLYGYNEVYQLNGLWFAYQRDSDGGSIRSASHATREDAEAWLREEADRSRRFWDEKVIWKRNGDRTPDSRVLNRPLASKPVVRVDGQHYVICREPTESELRGHRGGIGHAGARFQFKMLATGEVVKSRNVWYQGRIPIEYRELLPDNAVIVPDATGGAR